ncbi:MAG: hypothetical protein A3F54_05065 [Candidatus Kerfeldbacteria bacterium RIFCSPHIGHO2_12_FULL_48_17]|uniref:Uncharacterized protein n=1 Tax=Candidatus Kerfeldbacteria bacterium RIFCSPHIGHO2_12_FULL_48_17 TaxID=1798542 RepID=A0A1G2B3E4_9BACT|nr:MAG: hypothetical protein A3F54_05065 [Candidatus Kerfeldbacteria bacterium RIFCSPHIGHO2_12_FULL_48_17]
MYDLLFKSGIVSVGAWIALVVLVYLALSLTGSCVRSCEMRAQQDPNTSYPTPVTTEEQVKRAEKLAAHQAEILKTLPQTIEEAASYPRSQDYPAQEKLFLLYPFKWDHCWGPLLGPGVWHVVIYKWKAAGSLQMEDLKEGPAVEDYELVSNFRVNTVVDKREGKQVIVPEGWKDKNALYFFQLERISDSLGWVSVPPQCR